MGTEGVVQLQPFINVHTHTAYTHIHTNKHTNKKTCIDTHTQYTYKYNIYYIYIYTHTYIHTYIHTYTHTYIGIPTSIDTHTNNSRSPKDRNKTSTVTKIDIILFLKLYHETKNKTVYSF